MGTALVDKCPICGRPAVLSYHPFCSRRCADVDLGNWLGEAYRIPVEPDTDVDLEKDNEVHDE